MRKIKPSFLLFCLATVCSVYLSAQTNLGYAAGKYTTVIDGYDWGAAVGKVILHDTKMVSAADKNNYTVTAERQSDCVPLKGENASGEREVVYAYVSDKEGKRVEKGNNITLVLAVRPDISIANAMQYSRNDKCTGNNWVDYKMKIVDKTSNRVWDEANARLIPALDKFDLSGVFTADRTNLTYASYAPPVSRSKKYPLIIWLHGGGEGGTDPSIALMANKAANYASADIQKYFDGSAYVLVPQTPTRWMQGVNGETTRGEVDDIYHKTLMALILNYVANNPGIDENRIYVGGCSNGGYMSLKLILEHPDYFAAGYISALAYHEKHITDQQLNSIKNVPIWFIHAKDDPVTKPAETVVPLYQRLVKAGAPNVHFSYYDHVVDLSGYFGGENFHFPGHWSWIYSHVNDCELDYDGTPVLMDGRRVTLMEWMAGQRRTKSKLKGE